MITRYFTADVVGGGTSDQGNIPPELSETQSQSVDGTEPVTQDWMVPDQIAADVERRRQKAIALGNTFVKAHRAKQVKLGEGKEIGRRIADSKKSAKFAPAKNPVKRKLNTVAEQGLSSPRRSPRVDYSKRPNYAEVDVGGIHGKRRHADDHSGVDCERRSKLARETAAEEALDSDSDEEDVDVSKVYAVYLLFLLFFLSCFCMSFADVNCIFYSFFVDC